MAVREIRVSDLSGKEIEADNAARITVSDHPALGSRTVELDADVSEVENLESTRVQLVSIGVSLPGQSSVRRVVMEVSAFEKLFAGQDVEAILQNARRGGALSAGGGPRRTRPAGSKAARRSGSDKADYTAEDRFGVLHRGRVTEEEAALVRANLDQANRNRTAAGQPPIDPEDPKEKKRYGF